MGAALKERVPLVSLLLLVSILFGVSLYLGNGAAPLPWKSNGSIRIAFSPQATVGPSHATLPATSTVAATTTSAATTTTSGPTNVHPDNWTVYHHDTAGSGYDALSTVAGILHQAWQSPPLNGELYGEPLIFNGVVYVATETDYLYALSLQNGAILWQNKFAQAVDNESGGAVNAITSCGNINPWIGVTSTPVIDPATGQLFVSAATAPTGSPFGTVSHVLYRVDLATHSASAIATLDAAGPNGGSVLLQRAALTIAGGRVIVSFGGNYGDCSTYDGTVVSVPESGGAAITQAISVPTNPAVGDAVWMGGAAPPVDVQGNIWFASGNNKLASATYDQSNTVFHETPTLSIIGSAVPSNFQTLSANDSDLASSPPVLVGGAAASMVLQDGKQPTGYMMPTSLSGSSVTTFGGSGTAVVSNLCPDGAYGGTATLGSTVYLPCVNAGIGAYTVTGMGLVAPKWSSYAGGDRPPIVAGGYVWSIDSGASLTQLNASTGAIVHSYALGSESSSFPTPSASGDYIVAPASSSISDSSSVFGFSN